MNKLISFDFALAIYVGIAALVYGHAFHNQPSAGDLPPALELEKRATGAFIASAIWPLYVSAQIWEKDPKGNE